MKTFEIQEIYTIWTFYIFFNLFLIKKNCEVFTFEDFFSTFFLLLKIQRI